MKYLAFILTAVLTLMFASNAVAETSDYEKYRAHVDEQIADMGYSEIRLNLSAVIHTIGEPWYVTKYNACVEQQLTLDAKYGVDRKNKRNCSKETMESLEYRYKRLEVIVDALVLELDNAEDRFGRKWFWSKQDLALVALVKMYNESGHFDVKVHKGWKRGDKGRSFCNGQVWSRKRDKYYRWDLVGYDDDKLERSLRHTRNCTYMVYQHLTYHSYRCILGEKMPVEDGKDASEYSISYQGVARVYAGYGTGWSCNPYHKRPKLKHGKKVFDKNGKPIMVNGYEPMRRAKKYWEIRERFINEI